MPKADKYGTSQVMAFLQQLLTYQGFYNKLEFVGKPCVSVDAIPSSCTAQLVETSCVCQCAACLAHLYPCEHCSLLTLRLKSVLCLQAWNTAPTLCRRLLSRRMQACIFIQQRVAGVQRIQVVCSMNPATTVGRQPLAPRLAALMHLASMTYPPSAQLQTVASTLLAQTLDKACLNRCL